LLHSRISSRVFFSLLYIQICGVVTRVKFYGGWYLTEGACIFSGYGFNGYDAQGHALWNKAANVDVLNIEFCPNFKILLDSWNINTNTWLRNSVYKRLVKPGEKPTSLTTLATFMTSAIWHGISPGYYLTFFIGSLGSSAARSVRRYIRPLVLPVPSDSSKSVPPTILKRAYDVLGTVTSILILNYIVVPFMLLELRPSIRGWTSMYWYGHVVIIGFLVWGNLLGGFAWLGRIGKARVAATTTIKVKETAGLMEHDLKTPRGELIAPPLDSVVQDLRMNGNGTSNGHAKAD